MSVVPKIDLIPVDEYFQSELKASTKNEYVGGVCYAIAGGTNLHNQIASNALIALGGRLRSSPCRAFNSDTKIRLRLPGEYRFYYPDLSVVYRSNPPGDTYQDEPALVLEVISPGTRRIDMGEKRGAYLSIPSLNTYLVVETARPRVLIHRRTDRGFVREDREGLEACIALPDLKTELPLSELFDGVDFGADPGSS